MKRIMKITILSLWIYGVSLTNAQIMEQVGALHMDMGQLHQGPERIGIQAFKQRAQCSQRIDGQIYSLLSGLSLQVKIQIIAEFIEKLKAALEEDNLSAVEELLFCNDALYFAGIWYDHCFTYDEELASKLECMFFDSRFQNRFIRYIESGLLHRNHVLSICRFLCFAMKEGDIIDLRLLLDIDSMLNSIGMLFDNDPGLDALLGTCKHARIRLGQIEMGTAFDPAAFLNRDER